MNSIQVVLNISSLTAALAAATAAFFSYRQVRNASANMRTQIFLAFSDRYGDPSMSEAIIKLLNWYHDYPNDFAEVWYERYKKGEQEALELEKGPP